MSTNVNKLMNLKLDYNSSSDFLGAAASTLCMVHCLITPLLFAAHATTATCSEISPFWWKMIDGVFLIVSLLAIVYTARTTTLPYMPLFLYTSWFVLALLIVNNLLHFLSIPHAFVYIPGMSLAVLHLYNRKYCNCTEDACCVR